jgi:dTDP-glucose 4,6-dehydratase
MPNSPYSASKAGADLLARSYFVTYGLPVIITRSSNNFGPYQYPEKIIPLFITNLLQNKKVPLYADGMNVRDWLYVIDNCEAIDLILHKGKAGDIYNIGGATEITNLKLTYNILEMLGKDKKSIEYVKDRPGHDKRYSLDITKISSLGWRPKHDFKKALETTVKWYKDNETWWQNVLRKC